MRKTGLGFSKSIDVINHYLENTLLIYQIREPIFFQNNFVRFRQKQTALVLVLTWDFIFF